MIDHEYLTTLEVAARLGISAQTVRRWRKKRLGPQFSLVGGQYRYRADLLDSWVAAQAGKRRMKTRTPRGIA